MTLRGGTTTIHLTSTAMEPIDNRLKYADSLRGGEVRFLIRQLQVVRR
jgi:hypothetical protein